jgi:hypothetical protein
MIYKWKTGYHSKVPADIAGRVFDQLSSENCLTAKKLVEVSRPEDAPLHNAFEWNDTEAAERWREQQGRVMISSIVIQAEKKECEPVRAFFVIEHNSSNYEPITTIMRNEDMREKLYETAKRELNAFRAKYNSIKEFEALFREIDKIMEVS